jgi:hypothetical protein
MLTAVATDGVSRPFGLGPKNASSRPNRPALGAD